ncbi:hypothetical protein GCM10010174_62100 [Kutzneria viridogrisea]|uniref:Uncharacterized protein n=1 Tax=Kutzneria albida DSM 43870 TaxID=1449976 RepID=W5WIN3_9PSEU|nr:hypothetical protein KALB_7340 [Kutzneria albida DSM 43870]
MVVVGGGVVVVVVGGVVVVVVGFGELSVGGFGIGLPPSLGGSLGWCGLDEVVVVELGLLVEVFELDVLVALALVVPLAEVSPSGVCVLPSGR